jgi:D-arabinose 1-dehydrogenase-like Zn-dependent alcohol dehydrogenase
VTRTAEQLDDAIVEVEAAWLPRGVGATPGLVAGGAAVGRVTGGGEHAAPFVGARVLVGTHVACGECEVCRRGGAAVCPAGGAHGVTRPGTLAKTITVPVRAVLPLAGGLDVPGPVAAAIGGDLAVAYAMYVRASIGPREPAIVVGDDACAAMLARVLVAKGVTPAVGAEEGARIAAEGKPLRVFATTAAAVPAALALVGPRTTLVVRAGQGVELAPALLAREVTLHAVVGAHPDLLTEIAALVVRGDVVLDDSTVEVVGMEGVAAALASPSARSLVVRRSRTDSDF